MVQAVPPQCLQACCYDLGPETPPTTTTTPNHFAADVPIFLFLWKFDSVLTLDYFVCKLHQNCVLKMQ